MTCIGPTALPVAVAAVASVSPAVRPLLAPLRDVRQERHLARPLHRDGDLPLVAPAGSGDPPGADLSLLGDVAAELVGVFPIDLLDFVSAEPAVLLPDRAGSRAAAPALLLPVLLLCHQKGMSSSAPAAKSAFSVCAAAPAGTNCGWPPPSPSLRLPRNWTLSAIISTACRFVPSCASHSRHSSRPSTATGRPLARYWAQLSPWLPQTVMSK